MSTALQWFKSSCSTEQGGARLEKVAAPSAIYIRDSKSPRGADLTVTPATWVAVLALPQKPGA
ncbi:DUF397 domain-containing protein [Streptomyces sp. YS415]|uniref:DUF397 domain-containing protein n=1 Tax=Streptomyces sp. YS415 TaxID=2944806 RepID=UPI00201FE1FF|nr:DUF397 domain-containing protein [Streptomyces sp. YS415]MCL7429176.1 DUF397 domain-containing protein [Streptomyces sp. YS415]